MCRADSSLDGGEIGASGGARTHLDRLKRCTAGSASPTLSSTAEPDRRGPHGGPPRRVARGSGARRAFERRGEQRDRVGERRGGDGDRPTGESAVDAQVLERLKCLVQLQRLGEETAEPVEQRRGSSGVLYGCGSRIEHAVAQKARLRLVTAARRRRSSSSLLSGVDASVVVGGTRILLRSGQRAAAGTCDPRRVSTGANPGAGQLQGRGSLGGAPATAVIFRAVPNEE